MHLTYRIIYRTLSFCFSCNI